MGVVYDENSKYLQELRKWDTPKREGGMRCDGYEEFPRMLYYARDNGQGSFLVGDPIGELSPDLNRAAQALAFTKSCQMIVRSVEEQRRAEAQGWRIGPKEALDHQLKVQEEISTAAAEEQWRLKNRMGDLSRREFEAADKATHEHLPTLPPAPKKRGRKPKALEAAT